MLIFDFRTIGNKMYTYRKKLGMTQAEVAEAAGLSDRTYADIERGTVNMRIETVLRICKVLKITPDEVLTEGAIDLSQDIESVMRKLDNCSQKEKKTALTILSAYLDSLEG